MLDTAIILCAGKGTRMNDDSKNKVCFECAGVPVIRRIIGNLREAGVGRFVLVVGHQAQTVMDSLAGEEGVVYAYQAEQKGTGHAVRCGLQALSAMGFSGRVLVTMGDKIVSSQVIRKMAEESECAEALWGVQPLSANPGGGRVIEEDGVPWGVVELADVAYQSLAGLPKEEWPGQLSGLGLNVKKARKVTERAEKIPPKGSVRLNGREFAFGELLGARYANAGLYCFELRSVLEALENVGSDNAQGEIYLTDALEYFAAKGQARLLEIPSAEDMLTFSTKPELRRMSRHFLRNAGEMLAEIEAGAWDGRFAELYGEGAEGRQAGRYAGLLKAFMSAYGDGKAVVVRAPGRINLMGRHIDHRGGGSNVMVIDQDTVMVASPREDDTVRVCNLDAAYPSAEFRISEWLALHPGEAGWLDWLESPSVRTALAARRGRWENYVMSSVLRFQRTADFPLCGMDILATGNIAVGAGLSSSSSLVVATAEAIVALNCLNMNSRQFVDLCGEGEWLVGSRGGAGDHAAMKLGRRGRIVHLDFKPFRVGGSHPFAEQYGILVADSRQQSKKSAGSRDVFNARVASYEFGFMMLQALHPERGWREFRELAEVAPQTEIYRLLKELPERVTRAEVLEALPGRAERLKQIFASHAEPAEGYELRGVMLYGISECLRAARLGALLEAKDYAGVGAMMKVSHDGDRLVKRDFSDAWLDGRIAANADVALECGAYACSTERIDALCDLLNRQPGVLGSSLVGAGLGGCVIALVEKARSAEILEALGREFYGPLGLECAARVYAPSAGSSVLF